MMVCLILIILVFQYSDLTRASGQTSLPAISLPRSEKISPYDHNFGQHLTDHNIYTRAVSEKPDLTELRAALATQLPSVHFSDEEFRNFRSLCLGARDKPEVTKILWTLIDTYDEGHPYALKTEFDNLAKLTDETLAPAVPDVYYGARPKEVAFKVRKELDEFIVPSAWKDRPAAPNFFVEVQSPCGTDFVTEQRARIAGAFGCRAIHSLQNYGRMGSDEYDGKPYVFSWTMTSMALILHAHHVTAPAVCGELPHYHMTMIDLYSLWTDIESLCRAATAFGNVRDLAKKYRDIFIRAANARVQAQVSIPRLPGGSATQHVGHGPQQQSQLSVDVAADNPSRRPKRKRGQRSSSIEGNSSKRPAPRFT
jgi:hypothetical protein